MCGLFGFSDPFRSLTPRQARQLLRALSVSSMVRGTDATGIAYNSHDRLHIYKRPEAANKTLLLPSASARVVMGHVRMTTQGNAQSNYIFPDILEQCLLIWQREVIMHFKGMDSDLIMIKPTEKGWKRLNTWNHDKISPKVQKILGVRTEIRL